MKTDMCCKFTGRLAGGREKGEVREGGKCEEEIGPSKAKGGEGMCLSGPRIKS